MKRTWERLAAFLLLILGLGPRLALVTRFPTIPISDFNSLVAFGVFLRDFGLFSTARLWFWEYFNPALPLLLTGMFTVVPCADPAAVARIGTAAACGFLPLLPFLIWRGVLPVWVRLLAGLSLALWPGQIFFTGVVAQDNWVLLPTVALGALAVRVLFKNEDGRPVAAGLLFAAGATFRQEMLVALVPLFLAAAGIRLKTGWRRRAVAAVLAAGLPLLASATYRYLTTKRFSLSTEHAGVSILGSYVPGGSINGWVDPTPYVASVRPDLLANRKELLAKATLLAFHEALRRPGFQALRILSSVTDLSIGGETNNLYWSLQAPEVLPPAVRDRGSAFASRWSRPIRWEMEAVQGLFLAAVIVGIRRRNWAILALALSVIIKYAVHAITCAQGRYLLAATALEIVTILVAAAEGQAALRLPGGRALLAKALGAGALFCWVLIIFAPQLAGAVTSRDVDQQRTYRFPLTTPDREAMLYCVVDRGTLVTLTTQSRIFATIRPFDADPPPGTVAAQARCELTASGEPRPVLLQVFDPYAPGGLPDRILQRVELDGAEVFSHDIAREPGTGWMNIPLGTAGAGTHKKVTVEIRAILPDRGANWGGAAQTDFQITRP